jgi:hypothetical protein
MGELLLTIPGMVNATTKDAMISSGHDYRLHSDTIIGLFDAQPYQSVLSRVTWQTIAAYNSIWVIGPKQCLPIGLGFTARQIIISTDTSNNSGSSIYLLSLNAQPVKESFFPVIAVRLVPLRSTLPPVSYKRTVPIYLVTHHLFDLLQTRVQRLHTTGTP